MKMRYHLQNKTKFIEFPHDTLGLADARQYRKEHADFQGKHIREVLQAYPSVVYCYREYLIGDGELKP